MSMRISVSLVSLLVKIFMNGFMSVSDSCLTPKFLFTRVCRTWKVPIYRVEYFSAVLTIFQWLDVILFMTHDSLSGNTVLSLSDRSIIEILPFVLKITEVYIYIYIYIYIYVRLSASIFHVDSTESFLQLVALVFFLIISY